jgi:hypothetical protein
MNHQVQCRWKSRGRAGGFAAEKVAILKHFLCARRLFSGEYACQELGLRVRILYNILFTIFFVLSSPYYFMRMRRRGNWRPGFRERFGHYSAGLKQALTNRHVIWIHAVSVGEVNLCTQLIRALEPRVPNVKIVVSTTTTTGMANCAAGCPRTSAKFTTRLTGGNASTARWPSSTPQPSCSSRRKSGPISSGARCDLGIPVFLANARLSDRSYRGYKRFGFCSGRSSRRLPVSGRKMKPTPRACGKSAAGPKPSASSAT